MRWVRQPWSEKQVVYFRWFKLCYLFCSCPQNLARIFAKTINTFGRSRRELCSFGRVVCEVKTAKHSSKRQPTASLRAKTERVCLCLCSRLMDSSDAHTHHWGACVFFMRLNVSGAISALHRFIQQFRGNVISSDSAPQTLSCCFIIAEIRCEQITRNYLTVFN